MDKKLDNIRDEIQEWLEETARSYGTIPPSEEVDWEDDIELIYMGSVPRDGDRKLDNEPHWDKYDICFEDAFGDAISIAHMTDEIILKNDYINAERLIKRYRNVVIGFTNDKKLDSIRNEIQEWLEEVTREISDIPHDKKVHWGDIEDIRDIANKRKFHWDKYDIPFDEAITDGFDIDAMDAETLEGDFDTLIHLVKRYRNIVLSDEIASEYRKEEKKLPQVKEEKKSSQVEKQNSFAENNDIANTAYSIFCMFSQLSKEETDGYDCDEMWDYCHTLYATFCNSEFNDDNISEIDAMNKFLENIEERIAWCEINNYTIEMAEKNQKLYRVYSSITTKYFVDIDAINEDDAMNKADDLLEDCDFIEIASPSGKTMKIEEAELLEEKEVSHA